MSEASANEWQMIVVLLLSGYVGFYLLVRKWGPVVWYYLRVLTYHGHGERREGVTTRRLTQPPLSRKVLPHIMASESGSGAGDTESKGEAGASWKSKELYPASVWVAALLNSMAQDRLPHLLIVGESRGGKTTIARAIMSVASNEFGARLVILDPHTKDGDYPVPVIGRHRDFAAINSAMEELLEEFNWRFNQDHHDHEPLLIFIDEWPSIADNRECPLAAEFLQTLAREAGKIHMHLFILTTSPLVEDLKVNSATRRNFSKVLVGYYARQLMPGAFAKKERYATALEHKGQKMALGSKATRELAMVPIAPGCVWQPREIKGYQDPKAMEKAASASYQELLRKALATPLDKEGGITFGELLKEVELTSGESEAGLSVEVEQYVNVTKWLLMEKPEPSAREVARRLYGKDGGRYTMRAAELMRRVRKALEGGTATGGTGQAGEPPASH
jgi:hypothetical protein